MYIKEHTNFFVPDLSFSRLRPFIPNHSHSFPNVPVCAQLPLIYFWAYCGSYGRCQDIIADLKTYGRF